MATFSETLSMSGHARSASLAGYRDTAQMAGLDPVRMLREFHLPPRCLWEPEIRVPIEAVRGLLERSAERSGLESFGLMMAEARRMSDLGPLGLLVREQPTLRLALEACARYANRLNEALHLTLEQDGDVVVLREELLFGHLGPSRQSTELAIGVIFRTLRHFLGTDWRPKRVCFAHAAPKERTVHNRVFGVRVEFGHAFNGIVCTRADLDRSNPKADPGIARLARRLLESDTAAHPSDMTTHVRHLIVRLLGAGSCSIGSVAEHLGVDRRTVHRRLCKEGHTFTEVMRGVKKELASRYLEDPQRRLTDVAELLGFSTLSAFSRWYRTSFGRSARDGRAALARARGR
jgi:AraC-like DNA-binding protein